MEEKNETRMAQDPEREAAMAAAERLAKAAGVDFLPLDVVATLLPVQREWREFMKPKRGRRRK